MSTSQAKSSSSPADKSPRAVYTPEFAEWFAEEYAATPDSQKRILERVPKRFAIAPCLTTIQKWRIKYPEFDAKVKTAQKAKGMVLLEAAQEEALTPRVGAIKVSGIQGGKEVSTEKVVDNTERSKLVIQTMTQLAKIHCPEFQDKASNVEVNIATGLAERLAAARKRAKK